MSAPRTFELKPAVREQVPLLIGLVGPSGSGKTWSALRLATGIQRVAGGEIAVIDTEAKRALHYADKFRFRHLNFGAPFGSLDYLAAVRTCVDAGARVIVVDSMSHEHEGPGGHNDLHEQVLTRMAGHDYAKRERVKMLAWSEPKAARRKFLNGLLQLNCNFVFCFRAKTVSKPVKKDGKTEVVQMGFVPVSGDEFVYEMTANVLLYPKAGGVPTWASDYPGEAQAMKLPDQFKGIFAQQQPLSEEIGEQLARWAAGGAAVAPADALAGDYLACTDPQQLAKLEAKRKELWARLKKPEQERLKALSEEAKARLAPAPAGDPPPADAAPDIETDEFGQPIYGTPRTPEPDTLFPDPARGNLPD